MKKAVEWINENKTKHNIKFVIVLGDISDSGEYSELEKARDIIDELNKHNIPYIPVIGNHEIWAYTDDEENKSTSYFIEAFKDQFERLKKNTDFNLRIQSEPLKSEPSYLGLAKK